MFISVILPFVDFRRLQIDGPDVLERPAWPAATALAPPNSQVFQRNFGLVVPRPLKGLPGWVGESDICQLKSSAKIKAEGLRAKCVRKRLYFDGTHCGYISFSFALNNVGRRKLKPVAAERINKKILGLEVFSRHFQRDSAISLGTSGPDFARAFAMGGSSITSDDFQKTPWEPATFSGEPIVFQEGNHGSLEAFYKSWQAITCEDSWIFYKSAKFGHDKVFHNFLLDRESAAKSFASRKTRIVLGRLYLEALFLRSAVNFLIDNDLTLLPPQKRLLLSNRINESLVRLYGRKRPQGGMDIEDYDDIRKNFVGLFDHSRLQDLERSLRILGARRNLRWLLASSDLFEGKIAQQTILDLEGEMTKKETHFHGPVGAAIDGSARNFSVTQDNRTLILGQNKHELLQEIDKLKLLLANEIDDPANLEALRHLNEASKAIEAEQESLAASRLKAAGKWALAKAEKVGTSVAAAAIRHALGL